MKIKYYENDLPEKLDLGSSIAIDTETMGLNPSRDRLCLVQLSNGNNICHIVKIEYLQKKPKNLINILKNKSILKIFHYARADLLFIKKYLGINVQNISCTKIMSKIARSYTDKHGLKDLIKEFIGIDVSKQFQNSDFGGELSSAQLKYCANDVIYLHKIHEELNKILIREKRIELYKECIKFLKIRVDLDLALFKEDIWAH